MSNKCGIIVGNG